MRLRSTVNDTAGFYGKWTKGDVVVRYHNNNNNNMVTTHIFDRSRFDKSRYSTNSEFMMDDDLDPDFGPDPETENETIFE